MQNVGTNPMKDARMLSIMLIIFVFDFDNRVGGRHWIMSLQKQDNMGSGCFLP